MRKVCVCCFTGQTTKNDPKRSDFLQGSNQKSMEISRTDNGNGNTEAVYQMTVASSRHHTNIINNHDFSHGMDSWHPNSCDAFVVSPESATSQAMLETSKTAYAVVTNRKETWQGLEQDITDRVSPNSVYKVTAWVGISGPDQDLTEVLATLKLEHQHSEAKYLFIAKTCASMGKWEKLEGTFALSSVPDRVVFFLEGPKPGIDLLVQSVTIQRESSHASEVASPPPPVNIITNHDFSSGLHSWHPNSCEAFVVSPGSGNSHMFQETPKCSYAVVTNRKETWQGLEQDITNRVNKGSIYKVSACVGVSGPVCGSTEVLATLKLEHGNAATQYQAIAKACVSNDKWEKIEGQFSFSSMPDRVVFYLEGPAPGIDLLIHSVTVHCEHEELRVAAGDESIILNPTFEDGLKNWSGRSCKVVLQDSMADGKIVPQSGKAFACATERTQNWNGIQQEITGRVERKHAYEATAIVRIFGNNVTDATVRSTLWVQVPNRRDQYIGIANVQATDKDWVQLKGKFLLNASPSRVVIYLEGPPAGTDILVNSFALKRAENLPPSPPPPMENPAFGLNIVTNSQLTDGTTAGWFPLGNCNLNVAEGSPHILPPMARDSLGPHIPLNGRYILSTNRTQTWMGPAQIITERVKLFLTYQVSAWVKIGSFATATSKGPQNVNVALGVDSQWVNGGQVEIKDDRWHEIAGSFRIEQKPSKVMVYIQGPSPGVDLMVAGLQIFPVDRQARIKYLKKQADKLRKRDVVLKFAGADSSKISGASIRIRQTHNSFPLGTCISRSNIDNEDFVDFFLKNFNWAVFGNELKWYWTEPQQGNFNYQDADDLIDLCRSNNIQIRGHCIFWEVQDTVQQWIQNLGKSELNAAVQNRLTGLLNRYKGKFRHYDVNNEMLHGSFYRDRLGDDVRTYMFKTAHELDPSAELFVNDYHVEDGCDTRSCPEKYVEQILDLQEKGATVGGIGVQGHIDTPVGPIVSASLDRLGILGLPVWFTELDVSSTNEHVRADDLETILWEAFAHPAVEGIMLWGFWELFMSRENSHLVNAEGDVNEAGKRFLNVKRGWLSHADGRLDEKCAFAFRGFQGTYSVEVAKEGDKKVLKTFIVDKGDLPLEINIDL